MYQQRNSNSVQNKVHVFSNEIFYITNFLDISTTLDFLDAINSIGLTIHGQNSFSEKKRKI